MRPIRGILRAMAVAGLLIQIGVAAPAPSTCLPYEPNVVTLVGTLSRHTFPGRPNYDNIVQGDEPERGLYLHLDPPI